MSRSSCWITADLLGEMRKQAPLMGFKVLAKEQYDPALDSYLIGLEGDNVPAARLLKPFFTSHKSNLHLTVAFEVLEE